MTSENCKRFGLRIKNARIEHGLSVPQLALEMSFLLTDLDVFKDDETVTTRTIQNYEAGNTAISFERALVLAAILNLDFEDFIPRELANTICNN